MRNEKFIFDDPRSKTILSAFYERNCGVGSVGKMTVCWATRVDSGGVVGNFSRNSSILGYGCHSATGTGT
jgi:hypothetical protein